MSRMEGRMGVSEILTVCDMRREGVTRSVALHILVYSFVYF